jgi:hypothetical protein
MIPTHTRKQSDTPRALKTVVASGTEPMIGGAPLGGSSVSVLS